MRLKPSEIIIEERWRKDLGDLDGLASSIEECDLGSAVTVSKDNILIDGMRRLSAWKLKYGDKPIKVQVYEGSKSPREMEVIMEVNKKTFTLEELYRAGIERETLYLPSAKDHLKGGKGGVALATSGEGKVEPIDTRELVARDLKISHGKWSQIKAIYDPKLPEKVGGEKHAIAIREKAEEDGAKPAYRMLQHFMTEKDKPKKKQKPDISVVAEQIFKDLIDCVAKLNEVWKYKDNISAFHREGIVGAIRDLNKITGGKNG